jgi:hypothetical protein
MEKNTTSYTKLRRLKCVELYTQVNVDGGEALEIIEGFG